MPGAAREVVAAAVVAMLLLRELGVVRFPLVQNGRQVPQFVTRVPFWGALQFGTEMGTGMRTYSPTGLPHVIAVCLLLMATWQEAIAAGAGFATGRTLMLAVFLIARDRTDADHVFDTAMSRLRGPFAVLLIPLLVLLIAR
ncbi:hypothetical protein [Nonomuraea sediminis]|uniref:hypothetical protein n=1 Tax=Nonomuraea sediminis TaxID=2835864 RepID=UPI001BDC9CCE|nr:hypothetical protein [Nonomuraea sediminis]